MAATTASSTQAAAARPTNPMRKLLKDIIDADGILERDTCDDDAK
jgi:hypothetical protein